MSVYKTTNIVHAARQYMMRQTKKNRAPAWLLTEIAIAKAEELFKYYRGVNKRVVLTALYLAHTHFGVERKEQHGHSFKSAALARRFLKKYKASPIFIDQVVNAIEAHHGHVATKSLEAELMKNAEAFKFLTLHGALVMLHVCGIRGWSYDRSRDYTIFKMEQKYKLVTFPRCKKEAVEARKLIREIFAE